MSIYRAHHACEYPRCPLARWLLAHRPVRPRFVGGALKRPESTPRDHA